MLRHKFLAAVFAVFLATPAVAQSPQIGAGQVMGNSTAAQRPARAETVTAILDRAFGSSRGQILMRGAAGWQVLSPGTAGLALLSGGAGADLAYGVLGLSGGGCNAALTASNGGILYSTASACSILAGTATARQMLQSGAGAAPAWSTATWPATTTINQLLYSSSSNAIAGLPTANSAVLVTDSNGVPSLSPTLPIGAGRERLTADRDYFVRATGGSDTNCSGLANVVDPGSGAIPRACAFQTLQKSVNVILRNVDTAGFNINIGITGAFTAPMIFNAPTIGGGVVTVYTPATATVTTTSADAIVATNGAYFVLLGTNITLSTVTSGIGLWAYNYGAITVSGVTFGATASGHMAAGAVAGSYGPGNIYIVGSITVSGGSTSVIHVLTVGSAITQSPSATIALTGTPAFSSFFLGITKGLYYASGATPFSGSATGTKFLIHNGGTAVVLVAPSVVPGSVAGTVNSGGVYNDQSLTEDSFLGVEKLAGLNVAAPSTPASGYTSGWFDTTDKRFHDKNDAGTIGTTVVADTGASNNFLTAVSAAGAISKAQPTVANLADTGWTTYTPTVTSSAGSPTTVSATGRYKTIGKTVFLEIVASLTTIGTASGAVRATIPGGITPATAFFVGTAFETVNGVLMGAGILNGAGAPTYVSMLSSTTTFWVNGNAVAIGLTFEIQ